MSNEKKRLEKLPKHVKTMPKSIGLTDTQLQALLRTKITFNPHIRFAWLFILHTGMLFKEIEKLTVTELHSLPLNRKARNIIKQINLSDRTDNDLVFNLPPYDKCYVCLRLWSALAGLDFVAGFHIAMKTYKLRYSVKSSFKP